MTELSFVPRGRHLSRPDGRRARSVIVAARGALALCASALLVVLPTRDLSAQANRPPVAATTGPYTTTSTSLYIDGSPSSDPDGHALSYAWDFGDGTTGKYWRVYKRYPGPGTYTVTLVVTDSKGARSAPVTTTVTIHSSPTSVAGGPYPAQEGTPMSFDGSASSDPDGDAIVDYAWDFGDGNTGSGATPTHVYAQSGNYTATLIVTDARGGTGRGLARAWVSNVAPTVSVSIGAPATTDVPVTLTGGFTDPSAVDGPWSYTITWGDGTPNTTGSVASVGAPISASHLYAVPGGYTVTLRVADRDGGQGSAQRSITVTAGAPTSRPPIAVAGGPYTGAEGSAASFDGRASSDPDGDAIVGYAWDFGDGNTGSGATPTHVYAQSGSYTATLTVTDNRGESSSPATTSVTVANVAPVASAELGAASVPAGSPVTLTGGFTDPSAVDGPWSYTITWGDGTPNTTGSVASVGAPIGATHSYAAAGSYTVALRVRDKDGGEGVATRPITVTAATPTNRPPIAVVGGPYTGAEGSAVSFDGSASSDPDGDAITYAWSFGDGGTGSGVAPSHGYAQNGSYSVSLVVTDAHGLKSDTARASVTIANVAPTVSASLSPAAVQTGAPVTLSGTFTDPAPADGPWTYTVVWGDGTPDATGSVASVGAPIGATHSYATAGSYTVALQVRDKDGGQGVATVPITVSAAPIPSSQILLIAGDIADCSRNTDEKTAAILDRYPDASILTVGDNVYPDGTLAAFNSCYAPTWGRHKARTWPAVGNHEYTSSMPNAEGYHAYFGARAGPVGKAYYSTTIGDWEIYVLNSELSMKANSPQDVWLRGELAKSTKKCQLAVWHKPRYYSGTVTYERSIQKAAWVALYNAKVELIFGGHQHYYERFAPQNADGNLDAARGIRQFIVGTGGADPANFGTPAPNSELRENRAFGVLKLTLGSDSYSWEFLPAESTSFSDSGSGTCQ